MTFHKLENTHGHTEKLNVKGALPLFVAQHTVLASEDRTNGAVQDLCNPLVKKKKRKKNQLSGKQVQL